MKSPDLPPVAASSAEQKIIAALEAIRPRPVVTSEFIGALNTAPDIASVCSALTVYAARRLWAASTKRTLVQHGLRTGMDEYSATRAANARISEVMDLKTAPGGSLHTTERKHHEKN